jgi:hypothetical protein
MRNFQIVHGLAQALRRLPRLGQVGVLQDDGEFLAAVAQRGAGRITCLSGLERHHTADGLAALHRLERVVYLVKRYHMRDHRVDPDR